VSNYTDALRQELVAASDRLTQLSPAMAAQRRWWRRSPRALAVALAGLVLSATAIAATTTPWHPLFGEAGSPQPHVSGDAPPAQQLRLLGVLRRPQTPDDRGVATRQALRYFGTSTQGIHTDYIRQLPSGQGALAAILLPARAWRFPGVSKDDVLCIFIADPSGDGGGKACYTTADVENGWAAGSIGAVDFGLVPDGVAQVQFRYPSGTQAAAVHDNFFEHRPEQAAESGRVPARPPQATVWLDANGKPTANQPTHR